MQATPARSGVLVIDGVWLPSVADRLADLTEEFATYAESLLPEVVDACRVDGRLLAFPNVVNLGMLHYRSDLLYKYGYNAPPATWEELERMATVIQAGERAAGRRNFGVSYGRVISLNHSLVLPWSGSIPKVADALSSVMAALVSPTNMLLLRWRALRNGLAPFLLRISTIWRNGNAARMGERECGVYALVGRGCARQ